MNDKGNGRNPNWDKIRKFIIVICLAIITIITIFDASLSSSSETVNKSKVIKFSEFEKQVEKIKVKDSEVSLSSNLISVKGKYTKKNKKGQKVKGTFSSVIPKTDKNIEKAEKLLTKDGGKVQIKTPSMWSELFYSLLSYVPLFLIIIYLSRSLGNTKKVTGVIANKEVKSNVKFKDVAGCEEEKKEVQEIVEYLKSPGKYTKMGARIPKGILMVGSPGNGKTLLAKAVAGEAGVPFYSCSGSEFVEMFVGVGAGRVRSLFKKAAATAPCIIFIDEIDAIGKKRDGVGKNSEQDQTLNQILVEMDGMSANNGVIVVAATNRPDVLDPALLRSGRFDRQITLSLPDVKGREEILKIHSKNKKMGEDVDLKALAKRTPGFSGADLANVINEGAILAVRNKEESISSNDLDEAIDRVMMGPAKKSKKYTEKDKWLVAYHEAGHAVIGLSLEDADKVQKVTIIPRGDAGGYNLMTPEDDQRFPSKKALMAKITGLLGGRCAEALIYGKDAVTVGASNDIEKLTKIAREMVRIYGMSELGPVSYAQKSNSYLSGDTTSSEYSIDVARRIDSEVEKIVGKCKSDCTRILTERKDLLEAIAKELHEKETLTSEEIAELEKKFSQNNAKIEVF